MSDQNSTPTDGGRELGAEPPAGREGADTFPLRSVPPGGHPLARFGSLGADDPLAADAELLAREVEQESPGSLQGAMECLRLLTEYRQTRSYPLPPPATADLPHPFGRFQLLELLGHGGNGMVYRAVDPRLGREVALKVPRPDTLWGFQVRERFLIEGQAAAVLDHPNIVPVYEAGEVDGVCYLTAAYCPGVTLARWHRERTEPVPVELAVRLVAALADGVGHAHSRGILHRDLKPSNVLLSPGPESPRVTDFGLARLIAVGHGETFTGQVMGTPGYMSPEQAAGDNARVGTYSDVYALGVILYELLTGGRPFADAERTEELRLVIGGEVPVPRRGGKRLPRDLESVCLKCLEQSPADRYPTGRELADDLRRYLAHEPVRARPLTPWVWVGKWCRRRRAAAGFLAASLVSLAVLAVVTVWSVYTVGVKNAALRTALAETDHQKTQAEHQRDLAAARAEEARLAAYAGRVRIATDLWQGGQFGQVGLLLEGLLPRPGETDHREFAWRYLRQQSQNNRWVTDHQGVVRAITFDPVRRVLYSVSDDATIRAYDPSSGRTRRVVAQIGRGHPRSLAVSPDGARLAVAFDVVQTVATSEEADGDRLVRVWEVETGAPVGSLAYRGIPRPDLVFLDRDTVALNKVTGDTPDSTQRGVLIWNHKSGRRQRHLADQHRCTALAVSPDRRRLAAACVSRSGDARSTVHILSLPFGEGEGRLPEVNGRVQSVAFSPDGAALVGAGAEEPAVLWDVASRTERWRAVKDDYATYSVAFAEQGRSVVSLAVLKDPAFTYLRVRDAATGAETRTVTRMMGDAAGLAVDPRATWFAFPHYNLLQVARLHPTPAFERLAGHRAEVWGVAFTPDGKSLLTSSDDATVAVWDVATRTRRQTLRGHPSLASCVAASAEGHWAVSGDYDGGLILWDLETGQSLRKWKGHVKMVRSVAVSPDGLHIASGGRDRSTRLWNARTGEQLAVWSDHADTEVREVAFTRDGRTLVSAGMDGTVVVRELATGETRRFRDQYPIGSMALTPDSRHVLTGAGDGVPHVWDLTTGERRTLSGGHGSGVEGVAVSPCGRTVATAGFGGTVRLWHLPTGSELGVLGSLPSRCTRVAFSPDGNRVAAVFFDGSVLLWDGTHGRDR